MKQISSALKAHLAQETTTLASCWKLTRRDGTVMGFTDHDEAISYESVSYEARSGFTPSAVASSSALNVDNLDVEGLLDAEAIAEADILAGLYDFAEIEIFLLNYEDISQGKLPIKAGWLGEVTLQGGKFVAEVRGLTQKLAQQVGEHYSPTCRASLGDERCGVDTEALTVSGTVTIGESRNQFSDSGRSENSGYFAYGVVTFTSGDNEELSMEIKQYSGGQFTLVLPLPYDIGVGDTYEAIPGCDKNFSTCTERFNNATRFRGEPHVPGTDKMLQTSGTRN